MHNTLHRQLSVSKQVLGDGSLKSPLFVLKVLLVSAVGLSGCSKPPATGDIVIGRAHLFSAELYRKELQWELENPEHRNNSSIQSALSAGIPRQAIRDGLVLSVSCTKYSSYGLLHERFYLLLPKGIRTGESPVVEFEAVTSSWDRATQSTSYGLSKFIRLSDLSYHDVPAGCLWYRNGRLVEGYDASIGWAKGEDERDQLPQSLEDFRSE
jgi:hypothetical protein